MASRINYTVSLTPINTIPAQANDYPAHDMVDAQVGGSIAAQVSIPAGQPNVTDPMIQLVTLSGSTYGVTTRYAEVPAAGAVFAELYYPKILYVRNTGKALEMPGKLGDPVDATIVVKSLYTGTDLVYLEPGQACVLPLHQNLVLDESVYVGNAAKLEVRSLGGPVAVEAVVLG